MKLSNKDCWLIVGPGRTGSKVIVDILRNLYFQASIKTCYLDPTVDLNNALKEVSINKIVHSHKIDFFHRFKKEDARIVLSKRNMIDSALSWVIQREIGHWHIYNTDTLNSITVSKIKFDYDFFMEKYIETKKFYEDIKLDDSIVVIDYEDFKNDPNVIVEKLDLKEHVTSRNFKLSIKNPGSPEDWFLDWEEVCEKISQLDYDPPLSIK